MARMKLAWVETPKDGTDYIGIRPDGTVVRKTWEEHNPDPEAITYWIEASELKSVVDSVI